MPLVLVVDDSKADRLLVRHILAKCPSMEVACVPDGPEAIEAMEERTPDAVVTDLRMPKMNGLELVETLKEKHPAVPVIMMTGQGSEDVAAEALRLGAASYVPKRRMEADLASTVMGVIAAAQPGKLHRHVLQSASRLSMEFQLENDPALAPPMVSFLQEYLAPMGLCDESGRIRVGIALEEALVNALYHGNLEIGSGVREESEEGFRELVDKRRNEAPYKDRKIHLKAKYTNKAAVFTIRDEGPGFDPNSLPDPTDPANLEKMCGRGLLLIRTFMEASHNEAGNEITLRFPRRAEAEGDA